MRGETGRRTLKSTERPTPNAPQTQSLSLLLELSQCDVNHRSSSDVSGQWQARGIHFPFLPTLIFPMVFWGPIGKADLPQRHTTRHWRVRGHGRHDVISQHIQWLRRSELALCQAGVRSLGSSKFISQHRQHYRPRKNKPSEIKAIEVIKPSPPQQLARSLGAPSLPAAAQPAWGSWYLDLEHLAS